MESFFSDDNPTLKNLCQSFQGPDEKVNFADLNNLKLNGGSGVHGSSGWQEKVFI